MRSRPHPTWSRRPGSSRWGLELRAIDPASVAMVSLRIDVSAPPQEIGIDLERLSDLLSMADRGERVRLELL
ncbi:MAG TPA: hypothetical protein PK659_03825 [Methanothrix sp.]|nr:hypothetical protein [Methanothrix sp.]HOK57966.1 hypothetical protein [Methanothrix sp.]HOL43369.1 hypothetical protein [Methanothrix sp.]HPO88372.1 hypothetical protein [Methanothrix sp.]